MDHAKRALLLTLIWMSTPSPVYPRPPSAVEEEEARQRAAAWEAQLDATSYPPSPYASPEDLPPTLEIERPYQAFNDWYYFALVDGRLWYKPRMKRPTGGEEIPLEVPWRLFGHGQGLPYRLGVDEPSVLDTTWVDGTRGDFVASRAFESETPAQAAARLDPDVWARAGAWPHQETLTLSEDFPRPQRLIALTADDDEVAVLSDARQVFYRRKFANMFVPDEWMAGWGSGKKDALYLPHHLTGHRGWALGRITAAAAGYKEGPDGRIFEWGPAAVSMETFVWLSPDGHIIYYLDSGTSPEVEHFIEAPLRGRYRGEAINSAASTVMLIDRFGAVVTKIADFDLLGSTPTHPYCYFEECDDEIFYPAGDIRSGMSDIRLPPEGWAVHPPILPPEGWGPDTWLSTRISILQTGKGNSSRELRVVGAKDGVIGTWFKGITAQEWAFRPAPAGDRGFLDIAGAERLRPEELRLFTRAEDLAPLHEVEPVVDQALSGVVELDRNTLLGLRVLDFNLRASPWHVELAFEDITLPMELHVVQAWNPYRDPPWGEGKEHLAINTYEGTLSYDRAQLERRMAGRANSREARVVRELLDKAKNKKFNLIINAHAGGFELKTKAERRTGPIRAIALAGLAPSGGGYLDDWTELFWSQQEDHMAWRSQLEVLAARAPATAECSPDPLRWAASTRLFAQSIDETLKEFKHLAGKAAHFSTFTFSTSGIFYLLQLKTLDAALDWTRQTRSDEVRPNELRFNVISGVTTRIPYLARNIAKIERRRLRAGRKEARELEAELEPLLKKAGAIVRACGE